MTNWVRGLHHITGAATDGQKDHDFYTGPLGLRMVKKTINHETADQWHFFYGDYDGNAGTIMTNFIFDEAPLPPYRRGRGSITEVAYSVPAGSLDYWDSRLRESGVWVGERSVRLGEHALAFADPSGIPSELVECEDDSRSPRALAGVDPSHAIRGFHCVTLLSRLPELTLEFFTRLLRFEVVAQEGNRTRLECGAGGSGTFVDLIEEPDAPWGRWGLGGLHHVAFTVDSKEQMEAMWRVLSGAGLILTDLRDRKWFHSMYLTEPGGINVEFSNLTPGWLVDEDLESLGTILSLPKQWEADRDRIVAKLPPFRFSPET